MMASLLFEIWRDQDGSYEMSKVGRNSDDLRRTIAPRSVRVHSFRASTDIDAFRTYNKLLGHEPWQPDSDWVERPFTEAEQAEQEAYLFRRV